MFAISVELLAGRYVATAYNDRDRVEWPPHPARLFSALVAAWADGEPPDPTELAALEWLERLPPPQILASSLVHAGLRDVVPVFVPVNDTAVVSEPSREKLDEATLVLRAGDGAKAAAKAQQAVRRLADKLVADTAKAIAAPMKFPKDGGASGERQLPDRRSKQPRTFPSATPACSTIAFAWEQVEAPDATRQALASLLARLVRVGHSASFVQARLCNGNELDILSPKVTVYEPDDLRGRLVIRWISEGQCARLQAAFSSHCETEPRVLPARFVRYREGVEAATLTYPTSTFEHDFVVLARVAGPRLPSTSAVGVARQLRRALMSVAEQPVAEMISGHVSEGGASEQAHLAVVPLPVVSGPHPDGSIIGLGLILPRTCDPAARRAVMRAIAGLEAQAGGAQSGDEPAIELLLGDAGKLTLRRDAWGDERRATLQPDTWTAPSRHWATATPIALDRNPGDLGHADAAKRSASFMAATRSVAEAIAHLGLPPPVAIDVVRSCVLPGTSKPRAFPRFPPNPQRLQRVLVHARIQFAEPVHGPLLVGAGRYHGLGLCLPLDPRSTAAARIGGA